MRDHSHQEALYRSWLADHGGIVFKVTRSFARTPSEAAELDQEVRVQLWKSVPAFGGDAKPATWIYRVCLNTALTWRRGTKRHENHFDPVIDLAHVHANGATPAETAGEREIVERLYAAIQSMPDLDRAIILLSLDGIAHREIAEVMGMTEGHVGVALMRARQRLANLMKGIAHELK
ncbi:MAG: sigma-70 family RNA polymerase sigma factor [Opitutaceae bacterium]